MLSNYSFLRRHWIWRSVWKTTGDILINCYSVTFPLRMLHHLALITSWCLLTELSDYTTVICLHVMLLWQRQQDVIQRNSGLCRFYSLYFQFVNNDARLSVFAFDIEFIFYFPLTSLPPFRAWSVTNYSTQDAHGTYLLCSYDASSDIIIRIMGVVEVSDPKFS